MTHLALKLLAVHVSQAVRLAALLWLGSCSLVWAAPDLIIANAALIDPADQQSLRRVNLHFEGPELVLVTEDSATAGSARSFDAAGGLILGHLSLNQAPSLIILDTDPRENFSALLDTRKHTVFAMEEGRIVVNKLSAASHNPTAAESKPRWLAYTPPPFAVPVGYRDDRAFNRFSTPLISGIFTGALAVDRVNWLSQSRGNRQAFGDLDDFSGGEVRALRFSVAGTLNFDKPWVYVIAGATNSFDKGFETDGLDDFTFFDWRLDIPGPGATSVSIGKQKEPISIERLTGMVFLPWLERSVASDALFPSRNVGIVWSGNGPSKRTSWAAGLFNDWLDSDQSFSESASQFVGRMTWAPTLSGDETNVLHLGLGYRYTDAREGQRFKTEPEINKAPNFVDTGRQFENGLYDADRASLWNLEAGWRAGPFWLQSEYFQVSTDAPDLRDPTYDGYTVSASWSLTGEMREYDYRRGLFKRLPVAQSVYQGGHGAWEAGLRFSSVDLTDGLVDGGESEVASLGLNWWLTPFFQFGVNYRYIWNTWDGIDGTSSGITTRLLLILE